MADALPPQRFRLEHGDPLTGAVAPQDHTGAILSGMASAAATLYVGSSWTSLDDTYSTGTGEITWNAAYANSDGTTGAFEIDVPFADLPVAYAEGGIFYASFKVTPVGSAERTVRRFIISLEQNLGSND